MLETLAQGNDWLAFIETQEGSQKSAGEARASFRPTEQERHLEAWGRTDRPLRGTKAPRSSGSAGGSNSPWLNPETEAGRWLKEHDVHLEFVDGGIGCCWFAYERDEEPVCGETEEAALEKLARANGAEISFLRS
jgi:hypothetical protein